MYETTAHCYDASQAPYESVNEMTFLSQAPAPDPPYTECICHMLLHMESTVDIVSDALTFSAHPKTVSKDLQSSSLKPSVTMLALCNSDSLARCGMAVVCNAP